LGSCFNQLSIVASSADDEFESFADLFPEELLDRKLKELLNSKFKI
jgi:hypothetical protein